MRHFPSRWSLPGKLSLNWKNNAWHDTDGMQYFNINQLSIFIVIPITRYEVLSDNVFI